jgi:hypothetical protein
MIAFSRRAWGAEIAPFLMRIQPSLWKVSENIEKDALIKWERVDLNHESDKSGQILESICRV